MTQNPSDGPPTVQAAKCPPNIVSRFCAEQLLQTVPHAPLQAAEARADAWRAGRASYSWLVCSPQGCMECRESGLMSTFVWENHNAQSRMSTLLGSLSCSHWPSQATQLSGRRPPR